MRGRVLLGQGIASGGATRVRRDQEVDGVKRHMLRDSGAPNNHCAWAILCTGGYEYRMCNCNHGPLAAVAWAAGPVRGTDAPHYFDGADIGI